VGEAPAGIALAPDGDSAYVANFGDVQFNGGSVVQYDTGDDGSLTPKRPNTVQAGSNPTGIAVSADSASVHVTSGSTVFQFDIGPGGRLAPKRTPSLATGASSNGIALSPERPSSGRDVLHGTAGADVTRRRTGDDVIRGLRGTTGSSAAPGATGSSAGRGGT
jgi:hypothetical protein